jgi:hypothetical protein
MMSKVRKQIMFSNLTDTNKEGRRITFKGMFKDFRYAAQYTVCSW